MDQVFFERATDVMLKHLLDRLDTFVEGHANPKELAILVLIAEDKGSTIEASTRTKVISHLAEMPNRFMVSRDEAIANLKSKTQPDEIPILFLGYEGDTVVCLQTASAHYQPDGFIGQGGEA